MKNIKLKICGMKRNTADVAALAPDYLGFIFYDKSPRNFSGTIPELPSNVKKVGVFVDATIDDIIEKTIQYGLDAIQLHGSESADFGKKLKDEFQNKSMKVELWKVFSIKDTFDFKELNPYENVVNKYLFDTKGQEKGGNGYTFDWKVLKNYSSKIPFILSGGIGLEEIEDLKDFFKLKLPVYAIDVNSKFETEPGLKDVVALDDFIVGMEFDD